MQVSKFTKQEADALRALGFKINDAGDEAATSLLSNEEVKNGE
ncbi:MAG: hypothetical protein WB820_00275 [Rhodoplanes sp.]